MASAPSVPPRLGSVIRHNSTKFLSSRHFPDKWRISNSSDASSFLRFVHLHHHHPSPSHSSLSLRHRLLFPHPPLCSLPRPRSPHLRHFLFIMTTGTSPHAVPDSDQSNSTKTVRVVIKGRVQGVFYRNWTVENANQLGLKGWVRNRRDGSVEALFSGNPDSVHEMEQRCRRGPPDAMVTGFEVFPSNDDPGTRFERKQTV